MTAEPLATITVADWRDVEAYLAEHASSNTYTLTALTALHDDNLHHIVLDPDTRTIWWAYDNSALDGEGWTVEQLTPATAAAQASNQIDLAQDRMDNPDWYADGFGDLDADQEALDEYTEILRLTLPQEPDRASADIKAKRRVIVRQDALWQRAYANMVRDLVGTERGGKARAARQIGVTDVQIGRIIREDDQRREQTTEAVREVRDRR